MNALATIEKMDFNLDILEIRVFTQATYSQNTELVEAYYSALKAFVVHQKRFKSVVLLKNMMEIHASGSRTAEQKVFSMLQHVEIDTLTIMIAIGNNEAFESFCKNSIVKRIQVDAEYDPILPVFRYLRLMTGLTSFSTASVSPLEPMNTYIQSLTKVESIRAHNEDISALLQGDNALVDLSYLYEATEMDYDALFLTNHTIKRLDIGLGDSNLCSFELVLKKLSRSLESLEIHVNSRNYDVYHQPFLFNGRNSKKSCIHSSQKEMC